MTSNAIASNRYTEVTRKAIVAAAVDLLMERKSDGFSVQEVADRADVTHRTVYRHFPTRQALMAAAAQQYAPSLAEEKLDEVSTVEEWIDGMRAHLARTEANFDVVRSVMVAVLASDDIWLEGEAMRARDAHRWAVFRGQFPHLHQHDALQTFATLRHLLSSTSYVFYRVRFGLSPTEATKAIQTAAVQIADQATRRDRDARKRSSVDDR